MQKEPLKPNKHIKIKSLKDPHTFIKSEYKGFVRRGYDEGNSRKSWSHADFIVAKKMAMKCYDKKDIEKAILHESPNINERKGKYALNYVKRTVDKVMNLQEVIEKRQ